MIAGASLLSRALGVIRDRVLASQFGAGSELDIYYASFRIPDFVYNIVILGALSAGLIPIFVSLFKKENSKSAEDNKAAWDLINNILNIAGVFLIVVCSVLALISPWLIPLITPGFSNEKMQMTVNLTRIMFLSPLFLGLSGIFSGVLQSLKRFLMFSIAPIMYNLGIIFGAFFLVKPFGLAGLAYGVVLGALMHLLIQLPTTIHLGFNYRWIFKLKDSNFLKIMRMTGPRLLSLASSQINLTIITILASTLAAGSLAVFNLSNNLQSFSVGIFGISYALAAFPLLSKNFAENNEQDFKDNFLRTFKQILFFMIPITVLLIILRIQAVRVILGAGNFDWNDTVLTANCLGIFSLSLFSQALLPLLARAFYSRHNTKAPFVASLIGEIANLIFCLILIQEFGVLGLALGFTLSAIINFTLLALMLDKKVKGIFRNGVLKFAGKILFASLIMGVATQLVKTGIGEIVNMHKFWGVFTQGLAAGLAGVAVFALIAYLFKVEELSSLFGAIKRRLWKKATVSDEGIRDLG
ncbi:MAG: murein biosynthesis integral membrane protein MurJ [Parcubacteria group bacterium]